MKFFIRTQNKECLVELINNIYFIYLDSSQYLMLREFSTTRYFILGRFKKKENAIKVLDDIQRILISYSPLLGKEEEFYKVYQVPKEEEIDK